MEFHPLHHKHKVLKDATPCQVLCPRCGQQLGPAILMTLTAHVLSTCLFARTMDGSPPQSKANRLSGASPTLAATRHCV